MRPFTFETTGSKGIPLCPKLIWSYGGWIGLFLFMSLSITNCSQQENQVTNNTVNFELDSSGELNAITEFYQINLHEEQMNIRLGSGEETSLDFGHSFTPKARNSTSDVLLSTKEENFDLRVYAKENGLIAYDFIIPPGTDPSEISLQIDQDNSPSISDDGDLIVALKDGAIKHSKPESFQIIEGEKVSVESHFILEDNQLSFEVGNYDDTYNLVIDPTIEAIEQEAIVAMGMMACGVNIESAVVSGCYVEGNTIKATVTVEVSWAMPNAPNTDQILVQVGSDFKFFPLSVPVTTSNGTEIQNAKILNSPQVIAFDVELDANTSVVLVNANFVGQSGCVPAIPVPVTIPDNSACLSEPCTVGSDVIGGVVFGDNNFDGIRDPGETSRYKDVVVKIYSTDNTGTTNEIAQDVTDVFGNYSFDGLTPGERYRVEFELPNSVSAIVKASTLGPSSQTQVQFIEAGTCNADYAIADPVAFCQDNPLLVIPCFVNGGLTTNDGTGGDDALLAFRYSATTYDGNGFVNQDANPMILARHNLVGTIWGIAHNRFTNQTFSSSVFRRHSALGVNGLGGIYVTQLDQVDPNTLDNTGTTTAFLDLNADLGIDVGTEPANRNLPAQTNLPSTDVDAFSAVGKIGLGDIDISDSGDTLYVVNLFDQKIYGIDLTDYNTNLKNGDPASSTDIVNSFALDIPNNCSNGNLRPFALKYSGGKILVGSICDGTSGTASDLRAIVHQIDPITNVATEIFNFPLTYPKGAPVASGNSAINSGWYPWSDNYQQHLNTTALYTSNNWIIYPTPIFADIDIDLDGSLILSLTDRSGLQWGYFNYYPDENNRLPASGNFPEFFAGGDVLRAYASGDNFILENNGKAGPQIGAGVNNNQGPGFGEFYADNITFSGPPGFHSELAMGGIAILPGSGETVVGAVDPGVTIRAGGTRKISNINGLPLSANTIYSGANEDNGAGTVPTTFGKGIGLGDIELGCEALNIIAIGNYVWYDSIPNGLQDPIERPIEGLTVKLYNKTDDSFAPGTLLASTTTDENGNYQFKGYIFDDPNLVTWVEDTNLESNTQYYVVFGMDAMDYDADRQFFTINGEDFILTAMNDAGDDDIDSDVDENVLSSAVGDLPANMPFFCAETGEDGDVNFDIDVGLSRAFDYGDLPEDLGYLTIEDNGGPYHIVPANPVLKLGTIIDTEEDGEPSTEADGDNDDNQDDEDGFTPSNFMFVIGESLDIQVPIMNMSGTTAKLSLFIDWNGNGDLTDPGEMYSIEDIPNSATSATLSNITPPVTTDINTDLGVRFRISTDYPSVMIPTGRAPDGEVEDFIIQVMGFDYGDLADSGDGNGTGNYETLSGFGGPQHKIVTNDDGDVTLKIGSLIDAEEDGQQSTGADGDNSTADNNLNDEDGFNPSAQMFITGETTTFDVPVMNMTEDPAKLTTYIDWNDDGVFGNDEMYSQPVGIGTPSVTFNITPPLTATLNQPVGVRFRLTTDENMSPEGPAPDGEVEDYLITVMGFDYGDLNDVASGGGDENTPTTPADYPTLSENNGARHKIITNDAGDVTLKIGATVDDEANGQPSADAGLTDGDDNSESPDDEDGLDANNLPLFILTQTTNLTIPVMNMTGNDATIAVYVDFNKDGTLDPNTEKFTATVPSVPTGPNPDVIVAVDVPIDAVVGQDLGMRIRIASAMAEVMTATGPANSGEVEDYMVQIVGFDYGDLPDEYGTTDDPDDDAPKHIVTEDLLLGACVDTEIDRIEDASGMAGLMNGGDDNDDGLASFGEDCNDDEDGIEFTTPMIPGAQACIEVTAVNETGADATLQMWVDFDGDGTFVGDANEAFSFIIPDEGVTDEEFCFTVPAGAVFREGAAFVRFRLSPDGGLAPDSQTGTVPFGEIEDYKLPLAKIGNIVFEDYNFDGLQEVGEPGIDGVTVTLTWGGADNNIGTPGDNVEYSYLTGDDADLDAGEYYFCGLIGNDPLSGATDQSYKLTYQTPTLNDGSVYTATRPNVGNDDEIDSDGAIDMVDLTMAMEEFLIGDVTDLPTGENSPLVDNGEDGVGTFPDDQVDESHDQGFARLDYGDLPSDDPNDFPTLMSENGAIHTIFPDLSLGDNIDSEADGAPDADAGAEDGGDDATNDDEDGVDFNTPLVPGNVACVEIMVNVPAGLTSAVLQGWIDWDGDGTLDNEEERLDLSVTDDVANFFTDGALVLDPGANQVIDVCFDVPEDARFNEGMVFARFRLSENGGLMPGGPDKYIGPTNADGLPIGEVEDYKLNVAKLGNLVWEDYTGDGIQDEGEPGIEDVTVQLTWFGPNGTLDDPDNLVDDVVYTVMTDEDGVYSFCGLIGNEDYKITVLTPSDMTPGLVNQGGDDALDSDGMVMGDVNDVAALTMVMTETISLPEDVRTLTENEAGLEDVGDENTNPEPNDDPLDDVGTFPDNQVDERYDFAFTAVDFGDLPDMANDDGDYPTLLEEDGARHIIQPNKYLGDCVDAEREGASDAEAGLYSGGDDDTTSTRTQGTCTEPGDDENGVEFPTPLVPGYEACINVTYTAEDVLPLLDRDGNVYLAAWIDFNGNNAFEANERVEFTTIDGAAITGSDINVALANGTDVTVQLCFTVPGDATFAEGAVRSRFRLNCEDTPANVTPSGLLVGGEVEDYWIPVAKIGQYTWFDNDLEGDQEYDETVNDDNTPINEVGVNGVDFVLVWKGEDGVMGTDDDRKYLKTSATGTQGEMEDNAGGTADGIYYFCGLQEGSFQIVPLKYANPTNTGMDQVVGEDGTIYDITDPDNVTVGGVVTPRYELTPERKILTRPNDAGDDEEDSDGEPGLMFMVPDLVNSGFTTLNEDGNGDLPTIYNYPDDRTNLTIDFGWVQEPNVEVLQRIVGVDFPESGECDHFNVIVDVCMVNTAGAEMDYAMGVPLKNLQLMGDLSTQLGATFVDVVSTQLIGSGMDNNGNTADITELEYAPALTPAAPQLYPALNPNYNGDSDKNLFVNNDANPGFIWPGEKVMVRYVFEVAPEEVDMMLGIDLEWNLMGSGKATNYDMDAIPDYFNDGDQYMAMDLSNDFTGPTPAEIPVDGTYDDPDDPTNLGDCWKKASQFAAFDQVNFTANAACKVVLEEENLIQPYFPECDEEIYPLGGYYRFRIEGTPGIHFEPTEAMAASIVNGKIRFQVQTVNKACEPRWGELLLEDKAGPVITPPEPKFLECWLVDDVLNNAETLVDDGLDDGIGFLGAPIVTDGCEGASLAYTWADNIEYFGCENWRDDGGSYFTAVITRRFTATDGQGNSASEVQRIWFVQPRVDVEDDLGEDDFSFGWVPFTDADNGISGAWGSTDDDPDNDEDFDVFVITQNTCTPDAANRLGNYYPTYTGGLDCETGEFAEDREGYTYEDAFGNTVTLDEVTCNLSINDSYVAYDNVCEPTAGYQSYKETRKIRVFDWCSSEEVEDANYVVKVGDFEAPQWDDCVWSDEEIEFIANTIIRYPNQLLPILNLFPITPDDLPEGTCTMMVSTGPMNCTAAINSDLSALRALFGTDIVEDCTDPAITVEVLTYGPELVGGFPTGDSVWTIGGYVRQGSMIVGLPVGFHALVINASDACYNSGLGVVFFQVMDGVKPVMKCDDELRVTLVEGDAKTGIDGYALISKYDVDEGSWDNCGPVELAIRRDLTNTDARTDWELKNGDLDEDEDYSPWADIAEFFCADIGVPVEVQLRGTDEKGNESICWLDIDIENGTGYAVDISGGGWLYCTDEFVAEDWYDISVSGLSCLAPTLGVKVDTLLDDCGFGTYEITLDASDELTKNGNYIDDEVIVVTVAAVHDYWIKFPADVTASCADLGDVPGVVTSDDEDVACDLLAVYTDDNPERFYSNPNDEESCYKIFQTYKVINWCEYDGESIPVIVSRDWDAHNGSDCDDEIGEYNMNPSEPDGDGVPGDEDLYVIVYVDDHDETGIVYYDNNSDPTDESTADEEADNNDDIDEGYWWAVTKEEGVCRQGQGSSWYDDSNDGDDNGGSADDFDIDGTDSQDDDDDDRYGSFGYWQYTQHIKVKDDSAPVVTVGEPIIANGGALDNTDCDADVTLPIDIADECSVADLTVQVLDEAGDEAFKGQPTDNGDGTASISFPAGNLPLGTYKWTVRVNDGCGNITDEDVEFEVEDVKAPAPICHDGLQVELMPTEDGGGMAAVWASDFIASDIGDCSGTGEEVTLDGTAGNTAPMIIHDAYSIYRDADFTDTTYVSPFEEETVRGLEVTCEDLNNMVMVRVYAEDAVGNADYCLTFVQVQDNNGACGAPAVGEIAGLMSTESVEAVEGVEVQLSGAQSMMYMTNHDGSYGFASLAEGGDFTVLPHKDVEPRNGVSTFDLILIQKHILGSQALDSPYKMIAADVNNSKSISTIDLIQLRKLILNVDQEFVNNTSWRFVDADYRFADVTNPWLEAFPEVHNINNLDGTVLANFVAVKIGDVNESARANAAQSLQPRSITDVLELRTQEVDMRSGNVYTISFSADVSEIAGYQFTMELDPQQVEILDLKQGIAKAENFGVFTEQGLITSSYHQSESQEVKGEVLFSLTIRAKADAALSEVLGLSSRSTEAEAYNFQDEDLALGLVIGDQSQTSEFALYQNNPNPFQAETMISFKLPELMEGMLEFKDISGRTILLKEGDFAKGYNEVRLSADELPSAGVYFYTLHAGKYTATKKLILIK